MEQPLVIYRSPALTQSNGFDCSLLKAFMISFVLSLSFCPAPSLLFVFFPFSPQEGDGDEDMRVSVFVQRQ